MPMWPMFNVKKRGGWEWEERTQREELRKIPKESHFCLQELVGSRRPLRLNEGRFPHLSGGLQIPDADIRMRPPGLLVCYYERAHRSDLTATCSGGGGCEFWQVRAAQGLHRPWRYRDPKVTWSLSLPGGGNPPPPHVLLCHHLIFWGLRKG